ncbi:Uu.00g127070.m01.CDS01 [Anthostomella pinea]|uniref:Uu.00g127070.m01.CDS01 n=1 Tax=Anthostomella pinea TaxID=933095 RepID=A0AAI8VI38_9PEZI|nr:Uu.00g127070.m01.CDS01 [Anthostomella pinea]
MDYGLHDQHASYILSQSTRDEEDETDLDASWVMLSRSGNIEPLPHESILHKTKGRIGLSLTAPNQPAGIPPLSIKSDSGTAYITNQRLIYLPASPAESFKSFSSKILGCQDGRMCSSWIGPWYWEASVRPVPDGNIPPEFPRVNLKLTFKDGGSSEFESKFVELKARLHHAAQIAEESGQRNWVQTVHDEQLPEYTAPSGAGGSIPAAAAPPAADVTARADEAARQQSISQSTPDEPPPDYDEAQAQAITMQFDERLREEAERQ